MDIFNFFSKSASAPALSSPQKSSRVKFLRTVGVILIPSRQEYVEANIHLWYNSDEHLLIKENLREKATNYIKIQADKGSHLTEKQALRAIANLDDEFQPIDDSPVEDDASPPSLEGLICR